MRLAVVVETNFIKAIGLEQDDSCVHLARLAAEKKIRLVVPEYALLETDATTFERIGFWNSEIQKINSILNALKQSKSLTSDVTKIKSSLKSIQNKLSSISKNTTELIKEFRKDALIIPYTKEIGFRAHRRFIQGKPPFKEPDSRIYESVLQFCRDNQDKELMFYTTDRDDFDHGGIHQELKELNCEIHFNSGEVVKRVRELIP